MTITSNVWRYNKCKQSWENETDNLRILTTSKISNLKEKFNREDGSVYTYPNPFSTDALS